MTEIVHLAPHDPIPDGPGRRVIVMHRFDEDRPDDTVTTITLTGKPDETARPVHPDGRMMSLDEAIDAAREVASSEKLGTVFVIDRTEGEREQDILAHHGDHSVHMEGLSDDDMEDGERGADMRDRRP